MKNLTLLKEAEIFIEKWPKENGYTDGCFRAGCKTIIEGHQGRAIDFEYNGSIEELDGLDIDRLAKSIAENVIDDRFSVRVFTYNEDAGEAYKNQFCVEIWLND